MSTEAEEDCDVDLGNPKTGRLPPALQKIAEEELGETENLRSEAVTKLRQALSGKEERRNLLVYICRGSHSGVFIVLIALTVFKREERPRLLVYAIHARFSRPPPASCVVIGVDGEYF